MSTDLWPWARDPRQVNQVAPRGSRSPVVRCFMGVFQPHTHSPNSLWNNSSIHSGRSRGQTNMFTWHIHTVRGKRFRNLELHRKLLSLSFCTWRPNQIIHYYFHILACWTKCSNTKSAVKIAQNMEGIAKGISYLKGSQLEIYIWRST